MASRVERQSPVTPGGVAAMGGAMALCLIGLGQSTRATPTPSSLLFLGWIGAAGLIIVLCRVRLPQTLRIGCICATLGMAFLLAGQSDIFAAKKVAKKIADPASAGAEASSDTSVSQSARAAGSAGATVRLYPSAQGDRGWTGRLGTALAGGIGGPSSGWLTIEGNVQAQVTDGQSAVMVEWRISGSGKATSCGITSVVSRDDRAIAAAFHDAFEMAAVRSIEHAKPVCF
jgi:hypothetical protein